MVAFCHPRRPQSRKTKDWTLESSLYISHRGSQGWLSRPPKTTSTKYHECLYCDISLRIWDFEKITVLHCIFRWYTDLKCALSKRLYIQMTMSGGRGSVSCATSSTWPSWQSTELTNQDNPFLWSLVRLSHWRPCKTSSLQVSGRYC